MSNETFDIVITTNSPGELYSFVRPTVAAISKRMPDARIILCITPCQFASGREIEVARSFKEVYEIIFPEEFSAWLFKNTPPKGITFKKKGIVLFMGGDLLHAIMLSKKLGYKATAYAMDKIAWKRSFAEFFVPDERFAKKARKKRVAGNKIKIVGDLMVDGVHSQARPHDYGLDGEKPALTFMPGSRLAHTNFLAPFFLKTADIIRQKDQNVQFAFGLSPYTNFLKIEDAITVSKADDSARRYGAFGRLVMENGRKYIISDNGTRILLIEKAPHDAMNIADLIVTIPGTNTAEAASLGKPMIAITPYNKPEVLLFEGLAGLLGDLPVIGKFVKQAALFAVDKFVKYIALPNRKANKEIIPELRGVLTAQQVADKALELLSDKDRLESIGRELKETMGPHGAAENIAKELEHILKVI